MARAGYLVQILLPVRDNEGRPFDGDLHGRTRQELLDRFGGVTANQRAPAHGLWASPDGGVAGDEVVIFEVMARDMERGWWAGYRTTLERRFCQDVIVVRALPCDTL
jgi:hypothetical protein